MNIMESKITTVGNLGLFPIFNSFDSPILQAELRFKLIKELKPKWIESGGDASALENVTNRMQKYAANRQYGEAVKTADEILEIMRAGNEELNASYMDLHRSQRETFIADMKKLNITGIEDYIGWVAVEAKKEDPHWNIYLEDAKALKEEGFTFVAFLWIQTLPEWAKNNSEYVFASNVETGLETEALSIYAQQTLDEYDHFYGEAKRVLGNLVDILRIGCPYDFGETAYPAGAATFAFPLKNMEIGFWVNETPARNHFKRTMKKKYDAITKLNDAWATEFTSFDNLEYPTDNTKPRYWIDFVSWYHQGLTQRMGDIADIAQKHFSGTPININIGWPSEKINYGQDISGLFKMASEKQVCMRSPTGPIVPFLYTKRVATAARHYSVPKFSSEPVDGSATLEQMSLAFFKDLTTGINWHFDYTPNYYCDSRIFADYMEIWPKVQYPQIDTALFYPTSSHYLENWNAWKRKEIFAGGFPDGLMEYGEKLRDLIDYDVVDERLVNDGFLKEYYFLIWPEGTVAEESTLRIIKDWIEKGGTLLVSDIGKIRTVEGDSGAFADIIKISSDEDVMNLKNGKIIRIEKNVADLFSKYPGRLDDQDGVLISLFENGILAFNKNSDTVVKRINSGNGTVDITLEAFHFKWIDNC